MSATNTEQLRALLANENTQRYLRMLQQAEGTYKGANGDPYRVAFGGGTIDDLSQHPRKLHNFTQTDGKRNKTSAAGAYQFLGSTWDDVAGKLGLPDFGPQSQDLAALELMRRNGSLQDVLAGNFDKAVQKDGRTWASLPSSPYAQPRRSQGFVERALGNMMGTAHAGQQPRQQNQPQAQGGVDARAVFEQAMQQWKGGAGQQAAPQPNQQPQQSQPQAPQQAAPQQGAPLPSSARDAFEAAMQQHKGRGANGGNAPEPQPQKRGLLGEIGRQVGLTGRYAIEGLGHAADLVAEPINNLTRMTGAEATAPSKTLSRLADTIGLPKPEGGILEALGAGAGGGFGQVVAGAEHYAGAALDALGADSLGVRLKNDAADTRERIKQDLQPYRQSNPVATTVGEFTGNVVGTLPVGGVLGKGAQAVGNTVGLGSKVTPFAQALTTGGMQTTAKGVPGLVTRAVGGGVTGGAMAGLVDPDSATTGAVIGATLPVALQGAKKAGQAVVKALQPADDATAALARKALDAGAPIGPADISSNSTVKGLRSILNDNLFSGGVGSRQNAAKQRWFNRQVGQTFGAEADSLTPQVMDKAKQQLGAKFDKIWNNNSMLVDDALLSDLSRLRTNAEMLPKSEAKRLLGLLDDLEGRVAAGPNGSMVVPGDVANRFQSTLRRTADSAQGFLKNDLTELRSAVLRAFNRSVSEADSAALRGNQAAYKAFKTVEPLLNKAETGVAGRVSGDVPASLLPQAVANSYRSGAAGTPLAEVAQMGSRFLADRTPQTGGSAKALLQNSMVVGGLLGSGGLTSPLALIGAPAAVGLNKALGSAALSRGLLAPATNKATGLGLKTGLLRTAPLLGVNRD